MDDLLNEYIEQEKELESVNSSDHSNTESRNTYDDDKYEQEQYINYIERTKEYYYKMSCSDFIRALWFTASSCYICATEYMKYKIGWKSRNNAIIDVSKRLAAKNMMYVKIFQAFATNRNIVSTELNDFFSDYTDNVEYTNDEYDINELKELEEKSIENAPFRRLRILNDYTPIKSGLMSLIFKGVFEEENGINNTNCEEACEQEVVIKYLRKNISKNFNSSMNNLVVFAKLTEYLPYIRTLNIESLILQNIVSLKDQVCFRKELANINLYYKCWHDYEYVKIPRPYPDYTEKINPDVIVMEYVHGMKITDIDPEDNDEFGKVLALFNSKAAFCTSFYHGDLHPGNILFIKNETSLPTYRICILDFGIIGHLSRSDQELLLKTVRYMYQRRFNKVIDLTISCELSESCKTYNNVNEILPIKNSVKYMSLRNELTEVLVRYTTPEIRFFGVTELYELNYILNKYGLMFKRSLYRLFITLAIMDSIGTRLGSKMSYIQYMTDIIVEMYNINLHETVETDDEEAEEEAEEEDDEEAEEEAEEEDDEEAEEEAEEEDDEEAEEEAEEEDDEEAEEEAEEDEENEADETTSSL